MTDILGSFRRRAQDLIDSINSAGGLRSTVEGLRKQMAESDRRRAIHKARSDLKQLDAQINEMITAVGVQAVGLHRTGRMTAAELMPLCDHIIELEAAVAQQREELARLEATQEHSSEGEGRHCVQCGRPVPPNGTFCPYCGALAPQPPPEEPRFCANCGASLRSGARFCPRCGESVSG